MKCFLVWGLVCLFSCFVCLFFNSGHLTLWSFNSKRCTPGKKTYTFGWGKHGVPVWKHGVLPPTKFLHLLSNVAGTWKIIYIHIFSPWKIACMYSAVPFGSPLSNIDDNWFGEIILFYSPTDGTSLQNPVVVYVTLHIAKPSGFYPYYVTLYRKWRNSN